MLGLEQFFRSQFGSTPYIDLDLQTARVRVIEPMPLDFAAIGDGMLRNNVGVDAIQIEARVRVDGDTLVLEPTGQAFALRGDPPGEGWALLGVERWDDPKLTTLKRLPPAPVETPVTSPTQEL